jgi:ABC-type glycerol-3-phosphate transport system permease component
MAIAARAHRRAERTTTSSLLVRGGIRKVVLICGLAVFTIWTIFPIIWIIETSLKPNKDLYQQATLIPQHVTLVHYHEVIDKTPFFTYFKNSLIVSLSTTAIAMVIGVLSAYAITRLAFRGRAFMARATIVTYLVPGTLLFIPVFQIAQQLHLTNKASGLIVIYLIFTVPFCTWLAISYFNTIPTELEDAALVDGASRFQSLTRIIIPLALPALAVIALFAFTNSWNEFLFALLLIGRDSQKTIPAGLVSFINGDVYQWGALMASSLIASLPPILIYIIAQKWVVSGLAGGAVKG